MDAKTRLEKIKETFMQKCVPLLETKGHDYTQGKDANNNFKEGAKRLEGRNIDPIDVWAVYFLKHFDALLTWLNDREVRSEPVEGRVVDMINYLFIFLTLLEEDAGDGVASLGMADVFVEKEGGCNCGSHEGTK